MATSRRIGWLMIAIVVAAVGVGWVLYERLWRERSQPDWILTTKSGEAFGDTQFKYLSLNSERNAGIPYWVFYVLPSMFPEKLPGIGGYSAFGLPWEEGVELPIGMVKRVIGYPRVGINCALCHTARYRTQPDTKPVFEPAGPGHTANAEALSRFFYECAQDPRFNSDNILDEIASFTKLDWIDQLLYRFVIIPQTKERILDRRAGFLWSYGEFPAWGRGSDGPTYSSMYLPDGPRPDQHYGSTQFPAVWNLAKYQAKNDGGQSQRLNVTGDGADVYSVVVDSMIGLLGRPPHDGGRMQSDAHLLQVYLERKSAPAYPYGDDGVQPEKVASGAAVFKRVCASCHAKDSPLVGRVMPIAEVRTDPDYAIRRKKSGTAEGYVVPHLDGIWLRGPYLHNGSVPTVRDLLAPAQQRPVRFYRGYDVLDRKKLGFVSQDNGEAMVRRGGMLFDTAKQGNGNQGHEYGTELQDDEKEALIEFMKTL
jgi:mono/diheme cytochrome c family protein